MPMPPFRVIIFTKRQLRSLRKENSNPECLWSSTCIILFLLVSNSKDLIDLFICFWYGLGQINWVLLIGVWNHLESGRENDRALIDYLHDVPHIDHKSIRQGFNRNPSPIFLYLKPFHFIDLKQNGDANSIRVRA